MLRVNRFSPFLLAPLLFQFCSQEDPIAAATLRFQFAFALEQDLRSALPAGSTVVLSITTPSGHAVLTNHVASLKSSGDGFITEPIVIGTEQFLITEFMVMNDDTALYVTPKAGSEFAKDVNTPLSYIWSSREVVVPLQVVATRNHTAEKFGYRSLRRQKPAQWKIMVFTREDGVLEMSRAWSYLIAPGIAYGSHLDPKMNTLGFNGDPQQTYRLVVKKAGYVTYSTDFVYNDIRGKGNKPFKVILDRVANVNTFTITPPKAEGEFEFRLGLQGTGSLLVDWGDGTIESLSFAPDPARPGDDKSYVQPRHEYGSPTSHEGYKVSISGDLGQIFLFESISVYASDIDPRNLSGLKRLFLYGLPINGLLDLSANSQLQSISLEATYAWELRLPQSHEIKEAHLSDLDGILSQSVVDIFIENIYENAVAKNIMSGTMTILRPVELSAESAERIQQLVDEYGWEFHDTE